MAPSGRAGGSRARGLRMPARARPGRRRSVGARRRRRVRSGRIRPGRQPRGPGPHRGRHRPPGRGVPPPARRTSAAAPSSGSASTGPGCSRPGSRRPGRWPRSPTATTRTSSSPGSPGRRSGSSGSWPASTTSAAPRSTSASASPRSPPCSGRSSGCCAASSPTGRRRVDRPVGPGVPRRAQHPRHVGRAIASTTSRSPASSRVAGARPPRQGRRSRPPACWPRRATSSGSPCRATRSTSSTPPWRPVRPREATDAGRHRRRRQRRHLHRRRAARQRPRRAHRRGATPTGSPRRWPTASPRASTWLQADALRGLRVRARPSPGKADVVVAVTGDDEDNLVISLLAKQEFGVPRVVARVNNPNNEWMFNEMWGIDVSVSTPHLLTALVEEAVSVGSLVRLLAFEGGRVRLSEVTLADDSPADGKEIAGARPAPRLHRRGHPAPGPRGRPPGRHRAVQRRRGARAGEQRVRGRRPHHPRRLSRRRGRRPRRPRRAAPCRSARSRRWRTSASAAASEGRNPLIRDFVPLAVARRPRVRRLGPDLAQRARGRPHRAACSRSATSAPVSGELEGVVADGRRVRPALGHAARRRPGQDRRPPSWTWPQALIDDIERFRAENDCDRLVMVWCGSTEAYQEPTDVHQTRRSRSSRACKDNDVEHLARARSTPTPRCRRGCPSPTAHRTCRSTCRA